MKIVKNKSLCNYTSFRIGGEADYFAEVNSNGDILKAVNFAQKKNIPYVAIGNGSNILVNDKGYRGLIIKISNINCINIEKDKITCSAGLPLSKLLQEVKNNNLGDIEFLIGIPGTVGGAVVGNAGMKNKHISNILYKAELLKSNGKIIEVDKSYFGFGYRESNLKNNKDILLEATFKLKKISKKIPDKITKAVIKNRVNQPIGYSAGSIFKNPKSMFAGKIIEDLGMKGKKKNNAQISQIHANFIINLGGAKAADVKYLINQIKRKTMNKYGIHLDREIRYLEERGSR